MYRKKWLILSISIMIALLSACASQETVVSGHAETAESEPAPAVQQEGYYVGGQGPGGGVIFYDDQVGFDFDSDGAIAEDEVSLLQYSYLAGMRYLEAAPRGWNLPSTRDDPAAPWGADDANLSGIDDVEIHLINPEPEALKITVGNGARNTAAIVAFLEQRGEVTGTAAHICATYNGGGLDDWFLPSVGEMFLLFSARGEVGGVGLGSYNTSSESRFNNLRWVFTIREDRFDVDSVRKYRDEYVRPIRAFAEE